MKVQVAATVLLLSVGMFASRAGADELFTTASFSGPVGQATGLNYFDPSLGTLDSVNVQINGELQGVVVTAGAGCSPVCVPAPYNVQVDQTFSGLGGQFFSFDTPAQFDFTGAGTIGEAFPLDTAFSYSFNFTSTTDLIGFTVPSFTGSIGTADRYCRKPQRFSDPADFAEGSGCGNQPRAGLRRTGCGGTRVGWINPHHL